MGAKQQKTNFNKSTRFNFALTWADVDGRKYRQEILDLANKIGRTKAGTSREAIPFGPEYYALEPILDPYQAKIAMHLEFRKKLSASDVAESSGEPYDKVSKTLEYLAWAGLAFVNTIDGVDMYWQDIFVPGHLEMINNNKELVEKYPAVAEAFYYFGSKKGPMAAGIMPVGGGPMRVLPIERSIDGNTRKATYEELSKHLNEATVFSVSDCSCRTSREAMGEGCGHLKEEMCIQLDHAAEYYIKTGRGREITREEAFEIIRKAEDNGLMHSIPNLDEPGHTHAICNCCGCGCYAMRLANEYLNNDIVRSNYKSVVDEAKCVACGECVDVCPTNALRLGQKLCSKEPLDETITKVTPRNTEWLEDKWNSEYRVNRKNTLDSGTAPCITKCPAHIPVQGYIKLASQGKYNDALELIKKHNPLPAVCGRICPRLCEEDCTRGDFDEAVAVDDVKKFIAEKDLETTTRYIPKKRHNYNDKKIAIIGSGPSGLTCAYDLALDGYDITVFEKEKKLGGMLALGIPSYRLEKAVVEAEIDVIKEMGVDFQTGVEVGKDLTIQDLRNQGYNAFYIAIGAQSGRKLGIEGEEATEVISGVDFLRKINLGEETGVEGRVVVLGGGNVAIDVARTSVRLKNVKETQLFCLEARANMPAHKEEVEEALEEEVRINNSWGPTRIIIENGKVTAVEFKKCQSTFDEEGRFNPKYDETDKKIVPCDYVLLAVGQTYVYGNLLQGEEVKLTNRNTIEVDPRTLQTSKKDIFAGGDVASGPRLAIDAIAAGKEAAVSIHRFVQKGQSLVFGRDTHSYALLNKENLDDRIDYDGTERQRIKHVDGKVSKTTFKDLRGTLTEEQIKKETARCLSCGATKADEYLCVGCGACTLRCKFDAIKLERIYDVKGYELDDLPKAVIKKAIVRKAKIALNKINPFTETR
ncbi:FAD-dependent oxidoreductase [Alkaliphilus hydrothermalis]|uniref:NADPH-dependent glutamate synthase beta subunit-like oxidoreductase n=1 Tax=Alkaliphilus hydrothermalis TaxID=1482730 RepID=A0ABS2NNN0_9FIRM|nr:FAD-dependent oxidoreductase [Alkaliphilus hydrothermalis]MBM7614553.1 NADPH-dependent glutamate synthase beta subunit-like oxidoreductase [Alkaliphilus hydrothermalis]